MANNNINNYFFDRMFYNIKNKIFTTAINQNKGDYKNIKFNLGENISVGLKKLFVNTKNENAKWLYGIPPNTQNMNNIPNDWNGEFGDNYRFYIRDGNNRKVFIIMYDVTDTSFKTSESLTETAEYAPHIIFKLCNSGIDGFIKNLYAIPDLYSSESIQNYCVENNIIFDNACKNENDPICGCNVNYIHPEEIYNLYNILKENDVDFDIDNNKWCILPACASGKAFKPKNVGKSFCSNISLVNTDLASKNSENININMDNIKNNINTGSKLTLNLDKKLNGKCPVGQSYKISDDKKTIKCVKDANKNIKENYGKENNGKENNISSEREGDKKWIFIIKIILTIFILFLTLFIFIKITRKKDIVIETILLIILCVTLALSFYNNKYSISYYNTEIEKYSDNVYNKLCYRDSMCDTNNNMVCIENKCNCRIGYFINKNDDNVNCVTNNNVCNTLPYLPLNITSGDYIYSCILNNEIYVMARQCNFKYDGNKWVEIQPIIDPADGGIKQLGFDPYNNNNLDQGGFGISLYKNFYGKDEDKNTIYYYSPFKPISLYIYSTKDNNWDAIRIYDTSFVPSGSNNNSATALYKNIFYLFTQDSLKTFDLTTKKYNEYTDIKISVNMTSYNNITKIDYENELFYITIPYNKNSSLYIYTYDVKNKKISHLEIPNFYNPNIKYYNNTILDIDTKNKILFTYIPGKSGDYATYNLINGQKTKYESDYPASQTPENYTTGFSMNGFYFIIFKTGEIYRIYRDDKTKTYTGVPCYGVSNYGLPLKYSF